MRESFRGHLFPRCRALRGKLAQHFAALYDRECGLAVEAHRILFLIFAGGCLGFTFVFVFALVLVGICLGFSDLPFDIRIGAVHRRGCLRDDSIERTFLGDHRLGDRFDDGFLFDGLAVDTCTDQQ